MQRFVKASFLLVLALLAALGLQAPASAATGTISGSWGDNCSTIEVTSSGWPDGSSVHVRWYSSKSTPTPGVDGEVYVPSNVPFSRTVDPTKVRGFSFRVVTPDGSGGWTDLTPLEESAASCVVVLQPFVSTEATCDSLTIASRQFGKAFPYVIVTKLDGIEVDRRSVTGDQTFTVALPFSATGTWTVDTQWVDFPTSPSGIRHAEGTKSACPYLPPIEKVDDTGKRIEGAKFAYRWCNRLDGDPDWTCVDYGDDTTPTIGWTDALRTELYHSGGLGLTEEPTKLADFELTVWETSAPAGYLARPTSIAITNVCGGWHLGNRFTASCSTPVYAFDQAAYDAAGDMSTQKPLQIVNDRTVPVLHNSMPKLSKVDQTGAVVTGAHVTGFNCTRWDNDLTFQCSNLAEYNIDPSETNYLIDNIPFRWSKTNVVSITRPVEHRIVIWEDKAPAGYTLSNKVWAVDYACGAWRTIEVTGLTEAEILAVPPATCDDPVLPDNTFTWVNVKDKPTPTATPSPTVTTPTPSASTPPASTPPATTPATTPPSPSPLPLTGTNSAPLLWLALGLLLTGGAALLARRSMSPTGGRRH